MRRTPVHRRRRDDTLPGPALAEERRRPRSPTRVRSPPEGRAPPRARHPPGRGKRREPSPATPTALTFEQLGRTLRASAPRAAPPWRPAAPPACRRAMPPRADRRQCSIRAVRILPGEQREPRRPHIGLALDAQLCFARQPDRRADGSTAWTNVCGRPR